MRIHPLTTGMVRLKRSFLFPGKGARRQLDLFLPGPWSEPMPIHCWAVEHAGRLLLVDSGETAAAKNIPFARFEVTPAQELPAALAAAGLSLEDVSEVVLTHHHGDHVDGLTHVRARVRINAAELQFLGTPFPRVMRRILRQPLPAGFSPEPFVLDGGPFGAFSRSRALSEDGRHVMLAGDVADTLEQLLALRADAVGPDPKVHVATLEVVRAHCAQQPTVFLPSHDPESIARLAGGVTVRPAG